MPLATKTEDLAFLIDIGNSRLVAAPSVVQRESGAVIVNVQ